MIRADAKSIETLSVWTTFSGSDPKWVSKKRRVLNGD
jgi:hypothetical protein